MIVQLPKVYYGNFMSMIHDKAFVLENRWQLISATLGRAGSSVD